MQTWQDVLLVGSEAVESMRPFFRHSRSSVVSVHYRAWAVTSK